MAEPNQPKQPCSSFRQWRSNSFLSTNYPEEGLRSRAGHMKGLPGKGARSLVLRLRGLDVPTRLAPLSDIRHLTWDGTSSRAVAPSPGGVRGARPDTPPSPNNPTPSPPPPPPPSPPPPHSKSKNPPWHWAPSTPLPSQHTRVRDREGSSDRGK